MNDTNSRQHRAFLRKIAHRAMIARGLEPDFPDKAMTELDEIRGPATEVGSEIRDLRNLLWCPVDNDDSRDLDQLTVAQSLSDGAARVLIAIADVDSVVARPSALDDHALKNTTSVYTVAETFSMLPEKLSTDLTLLNKDSDRLATVIEIVFAEDGTLRSADIYRARVCNRARFTYSGVSLWLEGVDPVPQAVAVVKGLDEALRLQDRVAQKLKAIRYLHGALDLEIIEACPVFDGDELKDLRSDDRSRAKDIIQDFMIAPPTVSRRGIWRLRVFRLSGGWFENQSVGAGLSGLLRSWDRRCPETRTRWLSNISYRRQKLPILCAFLTSR